MSTIAFDTVRSHLAPRLRQFGLPVRVTLPEGATFDLGDEPLIVLILRKPGILRRLLLGDVVGLAAAYVAGDIEVEGRIEDIIEVGILLAGRLGKYGRLGRLLSHLPRLPRQHSKAADAAWVRYHYDVSDAFYALWLDQRMIYSCAYFENGDENIDRAQEQKLDLICRKLRLSAGERLLDIGCGWGGLLEFAAERYGIEGVGITISRNQYDYARRRIAERGLDEQIEIRLQDYRDLPADDQFDKVVSVGMYEHVGRSNWPSYFATLWRLLKTGGLMLNHGITTTDPRGGSRGPAGGGFLDKFVFPGGELPHISRVLQELARQGFDVLDVESLRPHYAATLVRWVRRLEAQEAPAVQLAGEGRYRIWRTYMAGCAVAFARNWLSVYQVSAGKCAADGMLRRPWTRRHHYVDDVLPVLAGALDWEVPSNL